MKKMTNMDATKKQQTMLDDKDRANELNDYFLRFNTGNNSERSSIVELDSANCNTGSFIIDTHQVQRIFSSVHQKKSAGPDGLTSFLFRNCPSELTEAWAPIFQLSVNSSIVPDSWKKSHVIAIPKICLPY